MKIFDDIRVSRLPNGITVISDTVPESPIMSAEVIVHTGSWHDPADKLGLAHFAEHLMANGHPDKTRDEMLVEIRDKGVYSCDFTTASDRTKYWINGSTEAAAVFLDYIMTAMVQCAYTPSIYETELGRIVNEMGDALEKPDLLQHISYCRSLHSEGVQAQLCGGAPETLPDVTLSDIVEYHVRTHVGENITVLISGPWGHEEAYDFVNDRLGVLEAGGRDVSLSSPFKPMDVAQIQPWLQNGTDIFVGLGYGKNRRPDNANFHILAQMFNTEMVKIWDRIGVYGGRLGYWGHPDKEEIAYFQTTNSEPGKVNGVLQEFVAFLRCDSWLTDEHFEKVKKRYLISGRMSRAFDFMSVNTVKRIEMMRQGFYEVADPAYYFNNAVSDVEKVTFGDVVAVAGQLRRARVSTCYQGALRDDFLKGAEIERMLRGESSPRPAQKSKASASLQGPGM